MAARTVPAIPRLTGARSDTIAAAAILAALAVVVTARFLALTAGLLDPILGGLAFGAVLLLVAIFAATTPVRPPARALRVWPRAAVLWSVAIGLAGGTFLIGLALVGRAVAGAPTVPPPIRADLFGPWALATILVATGEEAILRGALLSRLSRVAGWPVAIVVTSLVFALMHVPFYGWRVVPLDLGVGLWLAGLRVASGGILAPSIGHAIADLATWWL